MSGAIKTGKGSARALLIPMRMAELVLGTAFAGLAAAFLVGALRLPAPFSSSDVGPAAFPLLVGSVMLILAVAIVARQLFRSTPGDFVEIGKPLAVLAIAVTLVLYVVTIPFLGIYAASISFIAITMWLGGDRRPLFIAICAIGFAAFIYGCFDLLLQVPFP